MPQPDTARGRDRGGAEGRVASDDRMEDGRNDNNGMTGPSPASLQSNEPPTNSDSATPQPEATRKPQEAPFLLGNVVGEGSEKPPFSSRASNTATSNRGSGVGPRQPTLAQDAKAALGVRRWEAVRVQMTRQSSVFRHQVRICDFFFCSCYQHLALIGTSAEMLSKGRVH